MGRSAIEKRRSKHAEHAAAIHAVVCVRDFFVPPERPRTCPLLTPCLRQSSPAPPANPFKTSFAEPLHFGKPGAYVSPLHQHTLKKQQTKLRMHASGSQKKKKPARPVSAAPNATAALLSEIHCENRKNRSRPWSAPGKRAKAPAVTKPVKFTIRLGSQWCRGGANTTDTLLRQIHKALSGSSSTPHLPFGLHFDLRGCAVDECLERNPDMEEVLREIMIHPGVNGVDVREKEDEEVFEVMAKTMGERVLSRPGSTHRMAQSALVARESLRKLCNSPPLEQLLVDYADYDEEKKEEYSGSPYNGSLYKGLSYDGLNVVDDVVGEQSSGFVSEVTELAVRQGYLDDPSIKMDYNGYLGMPGEQLLPSFGELMAGLELEGELEGRGAAELNDEVEELRVTRKKEMIYKGGFNIRKSFRA